MDIRPLGNTTQSGFTPTEKSAGASGATGTLATSTSATSATAAAPTETTQAVQQPAAVLSSGQLEQVVKELNKTMASLKQGVEFSIDSDTHETIIKVVDQQTKEVIRQYPSKEALEIAKSLAESKSADKLQGLFIQQQA
jgi:flagellar protein FlaG